MYAILKHGGHQYRVSPGDRLLVDRLVAEVGSTVTLEPVLLVADGDSAEVGPGAVSGAHVTATVVAHRRGRKLRVFTYKPKKRHRRTLGYRSALTELLIEDVATGGAAPKRRSAKRGGGAAEPAAAKPEVKAESAPEAAAEAAPAAAAAETASPSETAEGEAPKAPAAKRAPRPRRKSDGA